MVNIALEETLIHGYVHKMFASPDNNEQAHLGWVKNPQKLPGLVREKPNASEHPRIVGRYNVRPKGGRDRNRNGPWLFCNHCQQAKHWEGYVLSAPDGKRFLIGSECGPLHYGAKRFTAARNAFKQIEERDSLRRRGAYLHSIAGQIAKEAQALITSEGLAAAEEASRLIQLASPDMFARLHSTVLTGEPLTTFTMVRGTSGKMEPAQRSIGRLEGAAVISCHVRTEARAMLVALQALESITAQDWEEREPSALLDIIRAVERAATKILLERRNLLKAADFFSGRNRRRLEQWGAPLRRFIYLDISGDVMVISDTRSKSGTVQIQPLDRISLPRLRCCEIIDRLAKNQDEKKPS